MSWVEKFKRVSLLQQLTFGRPECTEPLEEPRSVVVIVVVIVVVLVMIIGIVRIIVCANAVAKLADLNDASSMCRRCWRDKSYDGWDDVLVFISIVDVVARGVLTNGRRWLLRRWSEGCLLRHLKQSSRKIMGQVDNDQ